MKPRHLAVSLIFLSGTLLACAFSGSAAPAPGTAPVTPGVTIEATLPPLAPGTEVATRIPPTPTQTVTATPGATPTLTVTLTLTPTVTPRPVSSGPLDFTINIIGCRLDATRNGGVILKMQFDATGGDGVYQYYRDDQPAARVYERPATKGTAVIESYRVESGDGQRIEKKQRFAGSQFGCP